MLYFYVVQSCGQYAMAHIFNSESNLNYWTFGKGIFWQKVNIKKNKIKLQCIKSNNFSKFLNPIKHVMVVVKIASNKLIFISNCSVSEYLRMPPMARMDDYDRCFLDIPAGATATFCMVTSLIKPNETSDVWRIVNVSVNNE